MQYKSELEESRRWCVTPPVPPEGIEEQYVEEHEDVVELVVSLVSVCLSFRCRSRLVITS